MKLSFINLLYWIVVALAILLLAPYAGVHIVSRAPTPYEPVDSSAAPQRVTDTQDEADSQEEQPATYYNPPESLQDIEGLLAE